MPEREYVFPGRVDVEPSCKENEEEMEREFSAPHLASRGFFHVTVVQNAVSLEFSFGSCASCAAVAGQVSYAAYSTNLTG